MIEWLRILIDDILRLSREKNRPVSIKEIVDETNVDREDVRDAINEMEKEGLAEYKEKVLLTDKGKTRANVLFRRHETIEKFFGGKEAHKIAHSLEHFEDKDIEYMKEMVEGKKESLKNFKEGMEGIIAASTISNPKIISRLIGVGMAPASHFKVERVGNDAIILRIHNRLIVIDASIADKIFAVGKK